MTKHLHTCDNITCTNKAVKDKYGNYKRYCSDDCKKISQLAKMQTALASKDMNAILEKRKATVIAKYGVANVAQADSVRDKLRITSTATSSIRTAKTKATNLKNHGVESTNSLQSVKDKKKETFIEKYGVNHQLKIPEVAAAVAKKNSENAMERLAVAAQTKLEVYDDENYNNRIKYKETCVEKFGVENPSQNAEVHAKKMTSQFRTKEFIFPSGKIVRLQGYECKAVTELLKIYNESEIITETELIPVIPYTCDDNKHHAYFPDIYIPKDNMLIEVKSQYTYNGFEGWYRTNILKQNASIAAGYKHKFMIMGKK